MQTSSRPLASIATELSCQLLGDGKCTIIGVSPLDQQQAQTVCYSASLRKAELQKVLQKMQALALLVSDKAELPPLPEGKAFLLSSHPQATFVKLIQLFHPTVETIPHLSESAAVAASARIGKQVSLGAYSVVGERTIVGDRVTIHPHVVIYDDVIIGEDTILHSGVVVREGTRIGRRCIIHNGTIIGADGFGYFDDGSSLPAKVPQVGTVEIGEQVEIGANSCIDRATLGVTRIGNGTKIDNLVQIGHNVTIGIGTIICGQVGIAGSSKIGNGVVLGGGVGVKDHLTIADRVRVGARAGVTSNLTEAGDYAGYPAVPASEWRRAIAQARRQRKRLR